jgi:tetratricopeptide (TPR) repeat protein
LRRILARGLAVDRERRWPNMAALLAELRRTEQRSRRLPLAATAVAVAAVAVALFWGRSPRDASVLCATAAQQLDDVWSAEVGPTNRTRQSLARALVTALPERGGALAEGIFKVLDAYARRWQAVYQTACITQMASPTAPATQRAAAAVMACLDEKREQLRSYLRVASAPDKIVAENALIGASALVSPQDCEAPATGRGPDTRSRIAPADEARSQAELFRAKTLLDLGKRDEAIALAEALRREADARHDPSLAGDATLIQLHGDGDMGDCRSSSEKCWDGFTSGVAADRPDLIALTASIMAVCEAIHGQWDVADRWRLLADQEIGKLGPGRALAESHLLTDHALILLAAGRYQEAIDLERKSLALKRRLLPPTSRDVGVSALNLSVQFLRLGRPDEAEQAWKDARPVLEALAPSHPIALNAKLIEGDVSLARGDATRAWAAYNEAAAANVAGNDRRGIRADVYRGRAEAALALGRLDEAFANAEKVREMVKAGTDPSILCPASLVQAEVLRRRGSLAAGRAVVKDAIAALGPRLPDDVRKLEAWLAAHPPDAATGTRAARR